jgi:hypothetical protein
LAQNEKLLFFRENPGMVCDMKREPKIAIVAGAAYAPVLHGLLLLTLR